MGKVWLVGAGPGAAGFETEVVPGITSALAASQRTIATTLGQLSGQAPLALDGPAVLLVGEVFREAGSARTPSQWTPPAHSGSIGPERRHAAGR